MAQLTYCVNESTENSLLLGLFFNNDVFDRILCSAETVVGDSVIRIVIMCHSVTVSTRRIKCNKTPIGLFHKQLQKHGSSFA